MVVVTTAVVVAGRAVVIGSVPVIGAILLAVMGVATVTPDVAVMLAVPDTVAVVVMAADVADLGAFFRVSCPARK